ncbi:MAG: hypothetical protein CMN75_08060 [Spirochaeta sp.]|nr:hypothetical protein [Spirochaeta sp.]RPG14035.1 MAG: hypothetical protein CBC32_001100 [Proteobacteria bacterium TMED72]
MLSDAAVGWKKCSGCKEAISYSSVYYVCNVSTCNRKRTALQFCSVSCWEVHLPVARHREAWAEERRAPTQQEAARMEATEAKPGGVKEKSAERKPRRIMPPSPPSPARAGGGSRLPADGPKEVLIVASRLKEYVKAVSGYNTSDGVLGPLSEIVRIEVAKAIEKARAEGRKTVLDRDVSS